MTSSLDYGIVLGTWIDPETRPFIFRLRMRTTPSAGGARPFVASYCLLAEQVSSSRWPPMLQTMRTLIHDY